MEVALAASALAIVAHSLAILPKLKSAISVISRWKEAPLNLRNLLNEFSAVENTLALLERILSIREAENTLSGWIVTLEQIKEVVDAIAEDARELEEGVREAIYGRTGSGDLGALSRARMLWNEREVEAFTAFYRAHKESLIVHLNMLNL